MKRILGMAAVAFATVLPWSGNAVATGAGAHSDVGGSALVVDDTQAPTLLLAGNCEYARYTAGVGGGGVTFTLVGEGSATGAYRGIPVVATGVACSLAKPDGIWTSGPEYLPGPASETDLTFESYDARGGVVCVKVYALLRQVPPGEPDALVESTASCH